MTLFGFRTPVLAPAMALHEIDQIIGNESTIDEEQLGRIRGIVLTTLNDWHQTFGVNAGCHEVVEIDSKVDADG